MQSDCGFKYGFDADFTGPLLPFSFVIIGFDFLDMVQL